MSTGSSRVPHSRRLRVGVTDVYVWKTLLYVHVRRSRRELYEAVRSVRARVQGT